MALCARNAHITVYDVTTWSWVNLVNPSQRLQKRFSAYVTSHVQYTTYKIIACIERATVLGLILRARNARV